MTTKKPVVSALQKVFGAKFDNQQVITARPDRMPFDQYRRIRRAQTQFIRSNHVM